MAYWALYNWFSRFAIRSLYSEYNPIVEYSKQLYHEWFESLSDEQKQKEIKLIERKHEEEKQRLHQVMCEIGSLYGYLHGIKTY